MCEERESWCKETNVNECSSKTESSVCFSKSVINLMERNSHPIRQAEKHPILLPVISPQRQRNRHRGISVNAWFPTPLSLQEQDKKSHEQSKKAPSATKSLASTCVAALNTTLLLLPPNSTKFKYEWEVTLACLDKCWIGKPCRRGVAVWDYNLEPIQTHRDQWWMN